MRSSEVAYCIPLYETCFSILIMSKKDPAFLFYVGNWLKGTLLMSRPHKGAYMDLLLAQFENGRLSLDDIKVVLDHDYETMWESKLKSKFTIDANGLYYNEFFESVINDREAYKEGRLENLRGKKKNHKNTPYGKSYGDTICSNENKDINKDINNNKYKVNFEEFRTRYPGSKRGLSVEFENFRKKNRDWKDIIPLLLPALEREILYKNRLKSMKQFCPEWKILQTWINKKCWTEEYPEIKKDSNYDLLPEGEY